VGLVVGLLVPSGVGLNGGEVSQSSPSTHGKQSSPGWQPTVGDDVFETGLVVGLFVGFWVTFGVGLSVGGDVSQSSPSTHGEQSSPGWQPTVGAGLLVGPFVGLVVGVLVAFGVGLAVGLFVGVGSGVGDAVGVDV
jgi:hypothetical protein